jgi:hypothetical protein
LPSLHTSFETSITDTKANNDLFIQHNSNIYFADSVEYVIYSIDGKLIVSGKNNQVHIKHSGVYLLQCGTKYKTFKVVVK